MRFASASPRSCRCDRAFNPFLPRLDKAAAPLSPARNPEPVADPFRFLGSPTLKLTLERGLQCLPPSIPACASQMLPNYFRHQGGQSAWNHEGRSCGLRSRVDTGNRCLA